MDESNSRLREARKAAGFKSARAAALRHNWTPSTYGSHENGQTPVPPDAAKAYAKAFKVDVAWLLNLDGSDHRNKKNGKLSETNLIGRALGSERDMGLDDTAAVPEIDLRAGAGYAGGFGQEENTIDQSGAVVSQDVVRMNWGLPIRYLRDELQIQPDRVHILSVRGDSMNDALYDGDRAIINLDDIDVSQGGIFALLDDQGSVIIKQVELVRSQRAGMRKIRCTSRNPNYSPFDLEIEHPVRIIGRVASKITRL